MAYQEQFARDLGLRRGGGDGGAGMGEGCPPSRLREGQGVGPRQVPNNHGQGDEAHLPTPNPSRLREGDTASPTPTTRHDGWTPNIRVQFLHALANCGNVQSAALFVQRSRTSAYNLKRRDADFAIAWDAALLLARDVATDTLQDRAINGVEEEVLYHGEVVATRRKYDSRLLLAHITRLDKLAENLGASRAAARFEEVTEAIAAEEEVAPLTAEPTAAETAEWERLLAAVRTSDQADPAQPEEPIEPFVCTFMDDPTEIQLMTRTEAEQVVTEVEGLVIKGINDGEVAGEGAGGDGDGDAEGDEENKEHDPVHIVNFGGEDLSKNNATPPRHPREPHRHPRGGGDQ